MPNLGSTETGTATIQTHKFFKFL